MDSHTPSEHHRWTNRVTRKRVEAWHKRAAQVRTKRTAEEMAELPADHEKPLWQRAIDDPYADSQWPAELKKVQDARYAQLAEGVDNKTILLAESSTDPLHQQAQKILDDLVAQNSALVTTRPRLHIHTAKSTLSSNMLGGPQMDHEAVPWGGQASFPEIIETNVAGVKAHLGEKGESYFRALMAHELGHQVNGDNRAEVIMRTNVLRPMTHKSETLANRMGAILHGNVDEYARLIVAFAGHDNPASHPDAEAMAKDLKGWSAHLKKIGAAHENGIIHDTEKAVDAFRRSRFWSTFENVARHL